MAGAESSGAFDRIAELLEFPTQFPIKVMGRQREDFVDVMLGVVREHVPDFSSDGITVNESRNGNFLSMTVSVTVNSREQLENLYMALADHELVRIVL